MSTRNQANPKHKSREITQGPEGVPARGNLGWCPIVFRVCDLFTSSVSQYNRHSFRIT